MKRNAAANAAMLACCFDYEGKVMLPVADPVAIATLERAFTRMLQAGGEPMAVPLSEAKANAFPVHDSRAGYAPGGAIWLAVGVDVSGRATYSIQSTWNEDKTFAHEAARAMALSRLHDALRERGLPAWREKAKGDA